jgi:hypothetical protein
LQGLRQRNIEELCRIAGSGPGHVTFHE